MREFESPTRSLGDLDAQLAGRLLAASSDVALIIDEQGVIRDLAFGNEDLVREGYYDWLGKPWSDTVTVESRPKVDVLLRDSRKNAAPRWSHINHPSAAGTDLPMSYAAMPLPQTVGRDHLGARSLVFGRDLRGNVALQQQLISAQQAMERDYWRLRHMETRYRSLFQVASEAVLIVDPASGKIEEANPAATRLFGPALERAGLDLFDAAGNVALQEMLTRMRGSGKPETIVAKLRSGDSEVRVAASLFRQEKTSHILLRVATAGVVGTAAASTDSAMLRMIETAPDGFVVSDLDGKVLAANRAFVDLTQLSNMEQLRGRALDQWLGRTGVDVSVLLSNIRQRGMVRLFATVMRGEYGSISDVEISGVAVEDGEFPCLGLTVRDISRRLNNESPAGRASPRSVGHMTELVGRVPLKDIVRDTTDLIEQLCIEAALELTNDNRASAAEMLGLSRQSLYVKLRRFSNVDAAASQNDD